jgi:hypothetical protein
MLTFITLGPDGNGRYSVAYHTPGSIQKTQHSIGYSKEQADTECARLNECQVFDKRLALADRANRIVKDL